MSGKSSKLAEVASARIRFGVTLQSLVDKKGEGNLSSDEEDGSTPAEMLQSEPAIILSPTKRSTVRISRKRKRKDDEAMDGSQYHHTYVMKLFDRSVDLAQFDEEAALYPVCRAWLKNQPHNRSLGTRDRTPTPEPEPPTNSEEEEEEDIFPDVYKLPDPIKADPDVIQDYRIPMPVPQPDEELDIDADQDTAPPPEHLLLSHMERWKMVRQSWRDAGFMNELRFSDSMNVLREMFEQQMKESP